MKIVQGVVSVVTVTVVTVVGGAVAAFVAALAMAPYVLLLLGCFALARYLGWW